MLFRGSESKEEGMRLLKAMTETTTQRRDVKKYRFRVKKILRSVWVLNDTVRNQYRSLKICWRHRKRARRGWEPPMEEIDREDSNLLCVRCLCDEELYALGLCSDWICFKTNILSKFLRILYYIISCLCVLLTINFVCFNGNATVSNSIHIPGLPNSNYRFRKEGFSLVNFVLWNRYT